MEPGSNQPPHLFFIVGVPRSGTTLLRELLAQHADIALPLDELQLISPLMDDFGEDWDFSRPINIEKFIRTVRSSNAAFRAKEKQLEIDYAAFANELSRASDWTEVIRVLITMFLEPGTDRSPLYLGEKTPNNLTRITRFHQTLPGCKFIHIVRDPRDVCLSMVKAWGKSPYRAAVRWSRYLKSYARDVADPDIESRCHVLRYEDLVSDPEPVLRAVCEFLQLPFESAMLSLRRGAEAWGGAAGSNVIERGSVGRYTDRLSRSVIELIESICWDEMQAYGYTPDVAVSRTRISNLRYHAESLNDFVGASMAHVRDKGLVRGLMYRVKQFRAR
ncbi:MAG: sulfotransferase [Planctomycetota bacterium]